MVVPCKVQAHAVLIHLQDGRNLLRDHNGLLEPLVELPFSFEAAQLRDVPVTGVGSCDARSRGSRVSKVVNCDYVEIKLQARVAKLALAMRVRTFKRPPARVVYVGPFLGGSVIRGRTAEHVCGRAEMPVQALRHVSAVGIHRGSYAVGNGQQRIMETKKTQLSSLAKSGCCVDPVA